MEKWLGEPLRFVLVGVGATALHYALYCLLLGAVSHNVAYTVGYAVSFVCNYVLSSRFTFCVPLSVGRFLQFGASHALNYLIGLSLLNVFIAFGADSRWAPLPVFVIAAIVNFLLVRVAVRRQYFGGYVWMLVTVFVAMLGLCLMDMPTLSDDMIYRFCWLADDSQPVVPITGIADLVRSQLTHYQLVNGRAVVHSLAQAFLAFAPPIVLQVANALLFTLLVHLVVDFVGRRRQRLQVGVVTFFLLFVVFQGFRTTTLWGLGALNYLWVTVATLLWLRLLAVIQHGENGPTRNVTSLCLIFPLFLLSLLVGWGHEALSVPVSVAAAAYLLTVRLRSRLTPALLGYMAGTLLCLLSPGIWARSADVDSPAMRLLIGALNCLFNVRVLWILVVVAAVLWWCRRRFLQLFLLSERYVLIALAMAVAVVLLCGSNQERVGFFADFMAMLLLLRLLVVVLTRRQWQFLAAVGAVVSLVVYVPAYGVRRDNRNAWLLAEEQLKRPGCEVVSARLVGTDDGWPMRYFREHYAMPSVDFGYYCSYMGFDATDVNLRCCARLYGKRRVVFLPADVVERICHDSLAYSRYGLDPSHRLYVWRLADNRPVTGVTFLLDPEDTSALLPHQRLVAYRGDSYELDPFRYEVVTVGGCPYLVFTRPTTNIFRRTRDIIITQP